MQRGVLAGAVVVLAAVVLAAVFWPGGEDDVPAEVAEARRTAVLEARDANLARVQAGLVGSTLEVLVDEAADASGAALARGDADAPETDLGVLIASDEVRVGDRLRVEVEAVAETHDLIARPVEAEAPR